MKIIEKDYIDNIIKSMIDSLIVINPGATIRMVNQATLVLLGYKEKELIGKPIATIFAEEEEEEEFKGTRLQELVKRGFVSNYEVNYKDKSGKVVPVLLSGSVIRDKDGNLVGIVVVAKDISERRKAEEKLRQSEAFNSALFECNPVETIVVDHKGKVTRFNLAKKHSGNRLPKIGDVMYKDYAEEHEIGMHAGLMKCIRAGKPREFPEQKYGDKFLSIMISPFPHGAIITSQDITDRRRGEEILKSSRERLRRLSAHLRSVREEERTRIASTIHDELGQALTALKMDVSWLSKKFSREQKSLREKTKSMLELVDGMVKTVQGISTELRPSILDYLGLSAAIESETEEFRERMGIKVEIKVDKEMVVDKERSITIFRICQELLTNIARHANATRVRVNLKRDPNKLILEVKDNGRGIKEKEISSHRSFGLIEIQERVLSWGGKVKIKGIPNKGTTVRVSISVNSE